MSRRGTCVALSTVCCVLVIEFSEFRTLNLILIPIVRNHTDTGKRGFSITTSVQVGGGDG